MFTSFSSIICRVRWQIQILEGKAKLKKYNCVMFYVELLKAYFSIYSSFTRPVYTRKFSKAQNIIVSMRNNVVVVQQCAISKQNEISEIIYALM